MPPHPKPGSKADRDRLRTDLAASGADAADIAREMQARFRSRPREAWRHAHGWTLQEAADRLNAVAVDRGEGPAADASLLGKWEKWPAVSGRRPTLVVLTVLADLYGCAVGDLLDLADRQHLPDADLRVLCRAAVREVPPVAPEREEVAPAPVGAELVQTAAAESAEWAQWAEASNIGDIALEQLMADARSVAVQYLTGEPLPLFARTRALRDRVFHLLEGHQTLTQARDLYVSAGYLCGLLAWMSSDLGHLAEADTHGRTAWLCAELADHPGLRAWVLSTRSKVAMWDGRFRDAVQYARRGAVFAAPGTAGVLLACQEADAWAELGAVREAADALERVAAAREGVRGADDIGGLFSCGTARQANYRAAVHLRVGDAGQALTEAELGLAEMSRAPVRAYGTEAQLHISRGTALLLVGEGEGALEAILPVTQMPADQRMLPVVMRLRQLGETVARLRLGGSRAGRELLGSVEVAWRDSAPRALGASPSGG